MLNSLRKSAGSWVVKILLGLLVISFAIWGIGDIFRGARDQNLAEVGDREVSAVEFQRDYLSQVNALSNRLGRQLTAQEANAFGITQSVLQNSIGRTAIDIHADSLGLGISDEAIISVLHSQDSFEDANGAFDPLKFQEFLRDRNLSEQRFVTLQRGEMIRGQILSAFSHGAYVPETLLNAMNHYRNDERVLKYFVLGPDAIGAVTAPDEAVLKSYFDENKSRYMAPEYRKIGMLMLTPETIKDTIALTDEELKASYEASKAQYDVPERRKLQQLIFSDTTAARKALEQLNDGEDFVEVGKSLGMTDSDMDLGEFTKEGMADQSLAEAAFALEEGAYSEPVESFSTVIVKTVKVTPGQTRSFEDVKEKVRDELALQRGLDEIETLYRNIEDERATGANVEEAAKKLNLPYAEYTFDNSGKGFDAKPVEAVTGNRALISMTFSGDVGVENNPVTLEQGYAFLDVLDVIEERQRSFDEIREDVTKAWIEEETRKRLRAKADELVQKAKGGTTLDNLASELELQVKTTPPLKRDATPEELPPTAISQAFALPKDGIGTVEMADRKAQAVIQLAEMKDAPALDKAQGDVLRTELRQSLGVDILTQYVAGLQTDYGVTINSEAISALTNQ
jgi:peptidyl-prolyl cis-trans isomerase D